MEEERWETVWFIFLHHSEIGKGSVDRRTNRIGGRMDRQRDGGEEVGMDRRMDWRKRGMKGWTDGRK